MNAMTVKEINFGLRFNMTYLGVRDDGSTTRRVRIMHLPCAPESPEYRQIVRVISAALGSSPTPGQPIGDGVHTLEWTI